MDAKPSTQTMGDIETNEEAAGLTSHVLKRTESAENCEIDMQSQKPIFLAIDDCDVKKLSSLLRDPTTNVHVTDENGNTDLHCAVLSASLFCDTDGDLYNCIDPLMSQHIKVNMPNKKGYTAIGLAVHHLNKTCVERMLKHPSSDRLYLDYYPGDSEHTVREIIMQTYPELQPLLPAALMESLGSSERDIKLLASLQHDEFGTFRENLGPTNPNPWYDEPYYSSLLEIACQIKNRKRFVELLLENGANPNISNRNTGMPLLHATARSGNFELLEMFLEVNVTDISVKDNEDRTILHWLAGVSERKPGDKHKIENCLKLILSPQNNPRIGVDDRDSSGNTALCNAVERGFKDRAMLLLMKGADVKVFEEGSKILLPASLPILKEILDDCLMSEDKPVKSKEYSLEFKYPRLLWNLSLSMADSQDLRDLLRYPVISTFLTLKWQKIRWFFYFDLAVYVTFVLILTAYILRFESYDTRALDCNITRSSRIYEHSILRHEPKIGITTSHKQDDFLKIMWYFLPVFFIFLFVREIFQLIVHRLVYIVSLENCLEILLITAALTSYSGLVTDEMIRLHSAAVALFLGWLQLLLLSGRLPQPSVKLKMLKTVTLTFLSFMAGYVLLLIAFALSFYVLFRGSCELDGTPMFSNPLLSFLKTIVMFSGEYEASNLSFNIFKVTSHVIFLLFVVLMGIILLNLLNGLAVGDTKKINNKAETLSLVERVRLISKIDEFFRLLPSRIICNVKLTNNVRKLYPNKSKSIGSIQLQPLLSIIDKKRQRNKERESSRSQEKWDMFTEKLSALQLRQEKLEKKLDSNSDETRQILMEILNRLDVLVRETTGKHM